MSPLQKAFLRALCGFFVLLVVLSFLPQSPQSRRKGRKGVSVFIIRLIPHKQIPTIIQAPRGQRWLFRLLYSPSRFLSENFSLCPLWILCVLSGFIFLPQSPQSPRKGHQGVSVFIIHLIPYFNKVTLVFLSASSNFLSIFLSQFYISLHLGDLVFNILSFCCLVNKCFLFEERWIGFAKGFQSIS